MILTNSLSLHSKMHRFKQYTEIEELEYDVVVEESEYEGRKVTLNDPFRLPTGSKSKFGVYVKNDKGNVVKVTFGDPNSEIKRDDPGRRKSFRARHGCDVDPGPKWKAKYWSCYQWRAGAKVDN
jgi:NADPH-dependent glutamate synthase beta subunit-like oxidoreductase